MGNKICKGWLFFSGCTDKEVEEVVFVGTGLFLRGVEIKRKTYQKYLECTKCGHRSIYIDYGDR